MDTQKIITDLKIKILETLKTLSPEKFTDEYAYHFEGDWDKILGRISDPQTREKYTAQLVEVMWERPNVYNELLNPIDLPATWEQEFDMLELCMITAWGYYYRESDKVLFINPQFKIQASGVFAEDSLTEAMRSGHYHWASAAMQEDIKLLKEAEGNQEEVEGTEYCRKCSVTGEGMDEGWVTTNSDEYFKYEKDALAWCIKNGYADLTEAYEFDEDLGEEEGAIYWTQWNDDYQYVIKGGVLVEKEEGGNND